MLTTTQQPTESELIIITRAIAQVEQEILNDELPLPPTAVAPYDSMKAQGRNMEAMLTAVFRSS